jgi:hypothetical protein
MKITGQTVGTPTPRPDWAQDDPRKADFILNKPAALCYTKQSLTLEEMAQARANIGAASISDYDNNSGSLKGFFSFSVDEEGNLYILAEPGVAPNIKYDEVTGELYIEQQED